MHDKTLTEYFEDLKAEDPDTRIEAAIALGEWGNDRAVSPLLEALKHEDEDLRREAARALKEIGNKRAFNPLLKQLAKDSCVEVRAEIAFDLGYLKVDAALDTLIKTLEDEHHLVRQNAAYALGARLVSGGGQYRDHRIFLDNPALSMGFHSLRVARVSNRLFLVKVIPVEKPTSCNINHKVLSSGANQFHPCFEEPWYSHTGLSETTSVVMVSRYNSPPSLSILNSIRKAMRREPLP